MEKIVFKRVVQLQLGPDGMLVGLVTDSQDAKAGKYAEGAVEFIGINREQARGVAMGMRVKLTYNFIDE